MTAHQPDNARVAAAVPQRPMALQSIGSMSRGVTNAALKLPSAQAPAALQTQVVAAQSTQPAVEQTVQEPQSEPSPPGLLADQSLSLMADAGTPHESLTPDASFASPRSAQLQASSKPPKLPLHAVGRSSGGIPPGTGNSTARSSLGPRTSAHGMPTRKSMNLAATKSANPGEIQTRKSMAPKLSKLPHSESVQRDKDGYSDQLTARSSRINTARSHVTQASSVLKLEALEDELPGEARRGSDGSRLSLFQVLDLASDDEDSAVFLSRAASQYDMAVNKPWRAAAVGQKGSVESLQKRMKEREEVHRTLTSWVEDVMANRTQEFSAGDADIVDAEQQELEERLMDKTMRADPTGVGYQLRAHWNRTVQEEVELRFNKMRDKWESDLAAEMEELAELRVKVKELSTAQRDTKDKLVALQMKYDLTIRQARTPTPPPAVAQPPPTPLATQKSSAQPGLADQPSQTQPAEQQQAAEPASAEPQPTAADLAQFAEEILKLKDAVSIAKQERAQALKQASDVTAAMELTAKAKEEVQHQLERAKTEGAVLGLKLEEANSELASVKQELDTLQRQVARQAAMGSKGGDAGSGNTSPARGAARAPASPSIASRSPPNKPPPRKPPASSGGGAVATKTSTQPRGAAGVEAALGEDTGDGHHTGGGTDHKQQDEPMSSTTEVPSSPPMAPVRVSVTGATARVSTAGGAARVSTAGGAARVSTAGCTTNTGATQAAIAEAKAEAVTYKREMERLSQHVTEMHTQLECKAREIEELTERVAELKEAQKAAASAAATSGDAQKEAPIALARAAKAEAEVLMSRKKIQKLEGDVAKLQKELAANQAPVLNNHHFEVAVEVERTRRMQLLSTLQDHILSGLQTLQQRLGEPSDDPHHDPTLAAQAMTNQLLIMLQDLLQQSTVGLDNLLQPAPKLTAQGSLSGTHGTPNRMVNLKPSDLQGLLANSNAKLQQLFGMGSGGRASFSGTPVMTAPLVAPTTTSQPTSAMAATETQASNGAPKHTAAAGGGGGGRAVGAQPTPDPNNGGLNSVGNAAKLSIQVPGQTATAPVAVPGTGGGGGGMQGAAAQGQSLSGAAGASQGATHAYGMDAALANDGCRNDSPDYSVSYASSQLHHPAGSNSPELPSHVPGSAQSRDAAQEPEHHPDWTAFGVAVKPRSSAKPRVVRVHTVEAGASPVKPLRPVSALPSHVSHKEPAAVRSGDAGSSSSTASPFQRPSSAAIHTERSHSQEQRFLRQMASYVSVDQPVLSVASMSVRPRFSNAVGGGGGGGGAGGGRDGGGGDGSQPPAAPGALQHSQRQTELGPDGGAVQGDVATCSSPARLWSAQQLAEAEQRAREQALRNSGGIGGGLQWKPIPVGSTKSAGRPRTGGTSPTRARTGNASPERELPHQDTPAVDQLPPLVLRQQVGGLPPQLKHNVYQQQADQPPGAFKVRMITATPQKGIHHPRPEAAGSSSGSAERYSPGWGLNLEPGQGPPQLAPSPAPVMLSSLVGNTMGLSVATHTWALHPHGAPAGALLHVPGQDKPVVSPYELMSRSELVTALKALQTNMDDQTKRLSSVSHEAARAEDVRQELAAEVEEARRLWVAENAYNAMLQEELERMQAILEIITHTAHNIMVEEQAGGAGAGAAPGTGYDPTGSPSGSMSPMSPNSPEAQHAKALMMDLERINTQQETHMQAVDSVAEDLGLPLVSRASSPRSPARSPAPGGLPRKHSVMETRGSLHAGVFAPSLPHLSIEEARGLLSGRSVTASPGDLDDVYEDVHEQGEQQDLPATASVNLVG